jgi:hypothetical protein
MKFCKDCKHCDRDRLTSTFYGDYTCTINDKYKDRTSVVTGRVYVDRVTPAVLCQINRSEEGLCKQEGLLFEQKVVPPKPEPPPIRVENTTRDWGWLRRVICGTPKA